MESGRLGLIREILLFYHHNHFQIERAHQLVSSCKQLNPFAVKIVQETCNDLVKIFQILELFEQSMFAVFVQGFYMFSRKSVYLQNQSAFFSDLYQIVCTEDPDVAAGADELSKLGAFRRLVLETKGYLVTLGHLMGALLTYKVVRLRTIGKLLKSPPAGDPLARKTLEVLGRLYELLLKIELLSIFEDYARARRESLESSARQAVANILRSELARVLAEGAGQKKRGYWPSCEGIVLCHRKVLDGAECRLCADCKEESSSLQTAGRRGGSRADSSFLWWDERFHRVEDMRSVLWRQVLRSELPSMGIVHIYRDIEFRLQETELLKKNQTPGGGHSAKAFRPEALRRSCVLTGEFLVITPAFSLREDVFGAHVVANSGFFPCEADITPRPPDQESSSSEKKFVPRTAAEWFFPYVVLPLRAIRCTPAPGSGGPEEQRLARGSSRYQLCAMGCLQNKIALFTCKDGGDDSLPGAKKSVFADFVNRPPPLPPRKNVKKIVGAAEGGALGGDSRGTPAGTAPGAPVLLQGRAGEVSLVEVPANISEVARTPSLPGTFPVTDASSGVAPSVEPSPRLVLFEASDAVVFLTADGGGPGRGHCAALPPSQENGPEAQAPEVVDTTSEEPDGPAHGNNEPDGPAHGNKEPDGPAHGPATEGSDQKTHAESPTRAEQKVWHRRKNSTEAQNLLASIMVSSAPRARRARNQSLSQEDLLKKRLTERRMHIQPAG